MDITNKKIFSEGGFDVSDLTANIDNRIYSLHLININKKSNQILKFKNKQSSLINIEGNLIISNKLIKEEVFLDKEEGIHIFENSFLQISAKEDSQALIASTSLLPFEIINQLDKDFQYMKFSSYGVDKPWGWERWYTKNIEENAEYALKMIYMNKGNQSSLQSHLYKSETNFVIFGKANVLYGMDAPDNRNSIINISDLKKKVYKSNEGWSNKVCELHRVVAHETYKAIEVSTTELDDVVRWEDDSSRPDGKIEEEHKKFSKN